MTDIDSSARAAAGFTAQFGRAPRWIASAPGRVNLIGEFTDFNGGFVLPMAIERRTAIAAAPNQSERIIISTDMVNETLELDYRETLISSPSGHWSNYPKGVVAQFFRLGSIPHGFNAFISSDVPIGAGLSSSAALEAAMATLLEAVSGVQLDPVRKALLCQSAEHSFPQVPCGIMDPFISILGRAGHVLLLNCSSNEPEWISVDDEGIAVLIVNTNVRHELSGGEYALRRRRCESAARALRADMLCNADIEALQARAPELDPMAFRCARHVITENRRTLDAAACLRLKDWERLGRLMYASHESLGSDYQVSCCELDAVVEIAEDIGLRGGVYGCRMTGGGFGGSAVALVRASVVPEISATIAREYRNTIRKEASVFSSRPSAGASLTVVE